MPEGLDLIADLHAARPHLPLIAMTGWANVETAVEAMRRGARGYVPKPWSNEALVQVLRAEIDHARSNRSAKEWRVTVGAGDRCCSSPTASFEAGSAAGREYGDARLTETVVARPQARRRRHGVGPGVPRLPGGRATRCVAVRVNVIAGGRRRTCGHGQRRPTSEQSLWPTVA